ncbi:MAG: TIGR03087 family PEP-CTERM/XrtA system glycosyltransferase [Novosphingobium sp.]|nr:TIGR03087 family PEP-CTERM/XrtA system glycosyltransferase [Novosphingobium sp.]
MSEILFLAHRIPFPPDRGDKIRSHHVLKRLAEIAPVHVSTLAEDEFDRAEESALAAMATSYHLAHRSKPLALAGIEALAASKPVSLTAFHSRSLETYVAEVLASRPISAIYVFSGQMGQYVPASFNGRVVMDFVDVDSAKFEAYGRKKSGPRGWIDAREGRLLVLEEARLAERADISVLISDNERDLFVSRLPAHVRADIRTMGNGLDAAFFDPETVGPADELAALAGPKIVFTGQMDYAPNIEAAQRAMDRIMPLVSKACPDASFHVVGRNPPDALLARHGTDGNHVWGRVPDMREWLKGADLALVPLDIARGVQNKVLEAMAMGLPVVLSLGAATGIPASDGEHFLVGESDEALADGVISLLKLRERASAMGLAAREWIVAEASWQAALAPLAGWLGFPESALRDAA